MRSKWFTQYGHCKFAPNGRTDTDIDCWQLARLVYRDHLGVDLPIIDGVYTDNSPKTIVRVSRAMAEEREKWIQVSEPKEFDIVLMKPRGKMFFHVGIYIPRGKMLHIEDGSQVTSERIDGIVWQNRIEGFYRHASCC